MPGSKNSSPPEPTLVDFLPAHRTVEVPEGTGLVAAASQAEVEIELPCAGEGKCARCLVRITAGEADTDSLGRLPEAALAAGYVLACRTRVGQTPLTVEVPAPASSHDLQAADEEAFGLVDDALLPRVTEAEAPVVKLVIHTPPPQLEDGLSDFDRIARVIRRELGPDQVEPTLSVLRTAAGAVREQDGLVTVTCVRARDRLRVTAIAAGDCADRHHGIAVDVGTTTVAVQLIDLTSGLILATRSGYNDQISCGVDVISRINYAAKPGQLAELRRRVLATINRLICEAAVACRVNPAEISSAVVSGNTVMTHLLLGLEPEYIRLDPYTPTVLAPPPLTAAEVGIGIATDASIECSPCVGSYVGGDITAGLLCTGITADSQGINLFIDIGTNGEVVIGNADFLMGCACSAGPAFEGGGISCGKRAAAGAIDRVHVDPDTARPTCSVIGDTLPDGICGSGMIDLLANLLRTGWIDRRGAFDRSRPSPAIRIDGKRASYVIAAGEESATGEQLLISEAEIASIIRAKAAIYSATALMLERVGLGFADLSRIFIAGGFGRHLDLEQAVYIGMVPDISRDLYHYLGNASLMGSYMALLSREHRRRCHQLAGSMTYIELSTVPEYMDQYTAALFLPHTDLALFPSYTR